MLLFLYVSKIVSASKVAGAYPTRRCYPSLQRNNQEKNRGLGKGVMEQHSGPKTQIIVTVYENDVLFNKFTKDNINSWPHMEMHNSRYFQIGLTTKSTLRSSYIIVSGISHFFVKWKGFLDLLLPEKTHQKQIQRILYLSCI